VYLATKALVIHPEQLHIEKHIKWRIHSHKLSPQDVGAIVETGSNEIRSLAATQLARSLCNGQYTAEETAALESECSKHNALDENVRTKLYTFAQQSALRKAAEKHRRARLERQRVQAAPQKRCSAKTHGLQETTQATVNSHIQRSVGEVLVNRAKPMRGRGDRKGQRVPGEAELVNHAT